MFLLSLTDVPSVRRTAGPLPEKMPRWVGPRAPQVVKTKVSLLAPKTVWPVSALDSAALIPPLEVEPVRRSYRVVPDWQAGAACAGSAPGSDPQFFGVDDVDRPALPPTATAEARAYCARCPITRVCLTIALTKDERFGIWGSTTGRQRRRFRERMAADPQLTIARLVDETLGAAVL